jgi:serine/threonine-protein kinase
MNRDPAARFASVDELRVTIEAYLRHRGSRKLAWDAKQSLGHLLRTLENEPPGEERTLAVFNLLGECRFGYRAALSAWPENEAAQKGLDRALLAVVDHELAEGDPGAATALLREVSSVPTEVAARVETAVRARAAEEERLRRLGEDLDPTVGTRTRTFLAATFGTLWTVAPLIGWVYRANGGRPTHLEAIVSSVVFLAIGAIVRVWARETLSKTLLNRRLGATVGFHLCLQIVLAGGAMLMGLSPEQGQSLLILSWAFTQTLLAVWLEPWFGAPAAVSTLSFLVVAGRPGLLYPLMALDNAVLTYVLVRVWLPRTYVELIRERREEVRRRARKLFLDLGPRALEPREEE